MNKKRVKTLILAVLCGIAITLLLATIINAESSTIIFAVTYMFIIGMAMRLVWDINHKSSEKNDCTLAVFDMLSGSLEEDNNDR